MRSMGEVRLPKKKRILPEIKNKVTNNMVVVELRSDVRKKSIGG